MRLVQIRSNGARTYFKLVDERKHICFCQAGNKFVPKRNMLLYDKFEIRSTLVEFNVIVYTYEDVPQFTPSPPAKSSECPDDNPRPLETKFWIVVFPTDFSLLESAAYFDPAKNICILNSFRIKYCFC